MFVFVWASALRASFHLNDHLNEFATRFDPPGGGGINDCECCFGAFEGKYAQIHPHAGVLQRHTIMQYKILPEKRCYRPPPEDEIK